jgi:hypothetical protein
MIAFAGLADWRAGGQKDLHGLDIAFARCEEQWRQSALAPHQFAVAQPTLGSASRAPASTASGTTTPSGSTSRLGFSRRRRCCGRRISTLSTLILTGQRIDH